MMEVEIPLDISSLPELCVGDTLSLVDSSDNCHLCHDITDFESQYRRNVIDQSLIDSFKQLIKKYKMYIGDTENTRVVSGGLQQYLNKQMDPPKCQSHSMEKQDSSLRLQMMPVDVKLHIFSFLGARDLCRMSQVCQEFYVLAQDNILWQQLLERDVKAWDTIGHMTNPALYREVESEWSQKDIYLRCSPEVNRLMHQHNVVFNSISSMLRFLWPKKAPKIAMFGPGLESSTSGIVRRMLYEDNSVFHRVGLFPGLFEGVGAGMSLRMRNGQLFQLSVLYSAAKKVRENRQGDRMNRSSLFQARAQAKEDVEAGTPKHYELISAVRDLCRVMDAFVYVADASLESDAVDCGKEELFTMVNERWSATHVPVLVLSCVPDRSLPRNPCINIVEALEMAKLNRPWQVRNCAVNSLEGVSEGIEWLVEQSQRR